MVLNMGTTLEAVSMIFPYQSSGSHTRDRIQNKMCLDYVGKASQRIPQGLKR